MPTPQPPQASPDPIAKPRLTLVPKPPAGAMPIPQANTTCYHLIEPSPPYLVLLTPELLADEAVLSAWVEKSASAKNQRQGIFREPLGGEAGVSSSTAASLANGLRVQAQARPARGWAQGASTGS